MVANKEQSKLFQCGVDAAGEKVRVLVIGKVDAGHLEARSLRVAHASRGVLQGYKSRICALPATSRGGDL